MMNGGYYDMGWGFPFMGIFFFIFFVILIVYIVKMITGNNNAEQNSSKELSALEILKQRYARGEIDEKTYQQMKKNLDK